MHEDRDTGTVAKKGVRGSGNDRTKIEVSIEVYLSEPSRVHRVGEPEDRPSLSPARDEFARFFSDY